MPPVEFNTSGKTAKDSVKRIANSLAPTPVALTASILSVLNANFKALPIKGTAD